MKTQHRQLKKYSTFFFAALLPILSSAQEAATEVKPVSLSKVPDAFFEPATYLWVFLLAIVLAVFFALSKAVKALGLFINNDQEKKSEIETVLEKHKVDTTLTRFMKAMTRSVPIEQEADVMLDHDYDGIRELDNKLPPWWVWGFYLTIVFAFVYLIHYHVSGSGSLQIEEYNIAMNLAKSEKENKIKNDANYVTSANVVVLTDQMALNEGQSIFNKNCVACHGNAGQGGVGPNLTDAYWIHGGGINNIFQIITEGVPTKGMISWKSQFAPKQIQDVASYILTFQGTHPPDPKDPQGDIWEESSKASVTDTTGQFKAN